MYQVIRCRAKILSAASAVLMTLSVVLTTAALNTNSNMQNNYSKLYPNLIAPQSPEQAPEPPSDSVLKAYITFDDGPSPVTPQILDVLKELNVKATFFVIGRTNEQDVATLRRINEEGHSIGIHSYSHRYQKIYKSVENYLTDFQEIEAWIYGITGAHPEIFRFPGGSNNATAKKSTMRAIAQEMTRRGYVYYDWNVIAHDDQKAAYSADVLFQNVVRSSKNKLDRNLILLFHDNATRKTTPQVLPQVVSYFREHGYVFDRITAQTKPIQFIKPGQE